MSVLMMASQNPWENADDIPSKLNKYKRYLAKRHQEQQEQEQQQQQSAAVSESINVSPAGNSCRPTSADLRSNVLNGNQSYISNGNIPEVSSSNYHIDHRSNHTSNPAKLVREETCDLPLNLSLPSARVHSNVHEHVPTGLPPHWGFVHSPSNSSPPPLVMDVDDNSCVDEHFQRSLGSIYTSLQDGHSPQTPRRVQASSRYSPGIVAQEKCSSARAQIIPDAQGSVDEHFSKSLGDLWTRVKAPESPSNHSKSCTTATSVDDHFAKALGDTWFKIQSSPHYGNGIATTNHYGNGVATTTFPVQSASSPQRLRDMTYPH